MPELPEVQTLVNDLNAANLIGITIRSARVCWPRTIAQPSPGLFCRRIKGQTLTAIRRRGKYLVFDVADGHTMLLHLREDATRAGLGDRALARAMAAYAAAATRPAVFRALLKAGGAVGRTRPSGWFGSLPWLGTHWTRRRDFPVPAAVSFHERWKARRGT